MENCELIFLGVKKKMKHVSLSNDSYSVKTKMSKILNHPAWDLDALISTF